MYFLNCEINAFRKVIKIDRVTMYFSEEFLCNHHSAQEIEHYQPFRILPLHKTPPEPCHNHLLPLIQLS